MKGDTLPYSIENIEQQEQHVQEKYEETLGKNRSGFYDISRNAIELIGSSLFFWEKHDLDENGQFKNINYCLKSILYYNVFNNTTLFKAVCDLTVRGYYTESLILLRSILESIIKFKYIEKEQNMELALLSFAGRRGIKGKKFSVTIKDQSEKISPEIYKTYQFLCDITHPTVITGFTKYDFGNHKIKHVIIGQEFSEKHTGLVINQCTYYLLCYLNLIKKYQNNFNKFFPVVYRNLYSYTVEKLNLFISEHTIKEFDAFKLLI